MEKLAPLYLLLPAVAVIAYACGDNQKARNYNDKTVDQRGLVFITTANQAGLVEVKASTLASQMSKNQHIISFAKMMINDHTKASAELNKLANDQLVNLRDTITQTKQKSIDSLDHLTGDNFDKAYITMMIKDHEATIQLFQEETSNKNVKVRAFADKLLPLLKLHLDSANAISKSMK